jgi:hypothetical protein
MPISDTRPSERELTESINRGWTGWLMIVLYRYSWVLLALAAGGVAAYAFTVSFSEGARAIIFFVIPAMWGAYGLAVHDGQPKAIQNLSAPIANGLAVIAGLVVASVLFLDTPVSIANLALGAMEAFFFLMRISGQTTTYSRLAGTNAQIWIRAFLIMVTVTCGVIAIVI